MNTQVTTRVTINATAPRVFDYVAELKYHYLWNPHIETISPLGRLKTGVEYHATSLMFGLKIRSINHVTKCVQDQELEIENSTGLLHYNVNYSLSADQDKTIVRCDISVSADSEAFAFAKPVLKMLARRELQADLQALKLAVEQQLA